MGSINADSKIIDMVLLLSKEKTVTDLSASLIAAFHEVETFYNKMKKLAEFRYNYISKFEPTHLHPDFSYFKNDVKFLLKEAEDYIHTYGASKIASLVEHLLIKKQVLGTLLIITDQMLTPPRNWRYIIWSNNVVSIVPLDPIFWTTVVRFRDSSKEMERINIIKHRVRTACMSIVGSIIGLRRCNDECCFLYRNVDSFRKLDKMVKLGPGHDLEYLENLGFNPFSENPERTSQIKENPKWGGRFYESE